MYIRYRLAKTLTYIVGTRFEVAEAAAAVNGTTH